MKYKKYKDLDIVLREIYDLNSDYVKRKNIKLEREYFTEKFDELPFSQIFRGRSYDDVFAIFKEDLKNHSNEFYVSKTFDLMSELFLFSAGYDMMFKHKIKADLFFSVPMDKLIYPRLEKEVKGKFSDLSVWPTNPNYDKNIKEISSIVNNYFEFSSLLFMLYVYDWQFGDGWQQLFAFNTEILRMIEGTTITCGEFRMELINYKKYMMKEVLGGVSNAKLRRKYLMKLEDYCDKKRQEIKEFNDYDLPINYFLNHTFSDYLNRERKSKILIKNF